jgi:hypothetical protein
MKAIIKYQIEIALDICYAIDRLFHDTSWGKYNNIFGMETDTKLKLGKINEYDFRDLIKNYFNLSDNFNSSLITGILDRALKYYKSKLKQFNAEQNPELLKQREELTLKLKEIEDKIAGVGIID